MFHALAEYFLKKGWRVTILTGVPYRFSDGKIVPGYKMRVWQTETIDGIRIIRLPLYISQDQSGFRRMLCYVSFGLAAATLGLFGIGRPDVVYCYNLPTLGWAARLFRFLKKTKVVLMIQDLWPESVTESGMMKNRGLNWVLGWWARRFYRTADALTGLSPGFRDHLVAQGIRRDRISVVYNWTDENVAIPPATRPRANGEPFIVSYAGNMGIMQSLETVLDAADILQKRGVSVIFRLIGDGVRLNDLTVSARTRKLNNVVFVPRMPGNELATELGRAHALLVHLKKNELFKITIPSKTQAYLRSGKPIINGVAGEVARMIAEANAGRSFEPENPQSLADVVEEMSNWTFDQLISTGRNGQVYYNKTCSFAIAAKKLEELFQRVIKGDNDAQRI